MVDTGINRLGVAPHEVLGGLLDGLQIDTVLSHLACADEDSAMNLRQVTAFRALQDRTTARRMSLANSAGIALGPDYAFDLTRPGLALYGGVARGGLAAVVRQVVTPEAQILQRCTVAAGDSIGYNALYTPAAAMEVAILNIGYADGYWRGFSNAGVALAGDARFASGGARVDGSDRDLRRRGTRARRGRLGGSGICPACGGSGFGHVAI